MTDERSHPDDHTAPGDGAGPEPSGDDDAALLAELGALVDRAVPVPVDLVDAARATLTWRTVDEELAELTFDSLVDGLVGVRAASTATTPRQLSFEAGAAAVEVEVADGRLVGQLVPPGPAGVELHHATGSTTTRADDLGRFSFDVRVLAVPGGGTPGPWRLRVDGDTFRLVTAWFTP
jgi:hypothetical protein